MEAQQLKNIRVLATGSLAKMPNGIVPCSTIKGRHEADIEIASITPQELNRPNAETLIARELQSYPARLTDVLRHSYSLGVFTPEAICELGVEMLGVKDDITAQTLRSYFTGTYERDADVNFALGVFGKYAQIITSTMNPAEILSEFQVAAGKQKQNSDITEREKLERALAALPSDLVEAVDRLGVKIIIHDTFNSCLYQNRQIRLSHDLFENGEEYLSSTLREEMVHYVDAFLGFTKRAPWQAVSRDLHQPFTQDELIRLEQLKTIDPDAITDPNDILLALKEARLQVHKNNSKTVRKRATVDYNPVHHAVELLPDIINARESYIKKGLKSSEVGEELGNAYSVEAVRLADAFLEEVKQVANGTHPELQKAQTQLPDAAKSGRRL